MGPVLKIVFAVTTRGGSRLSCCSQMRYVEVGPLLSAEWTPFTLTYTRILFCSRERHNQKVPSPLKNVVGLFLAFNFTSIKQA